MSSTETDSTESDSTGSDSTGSDSTVRKVSPLVEELPVELVLELGRLQLSGAQVLELDVGDVLALNRALALTVDVRIGQRLLGRGELVDVDGEAGVRLVEVFD